MSRIEADFRLAFGRMAPQAIISRAELAALLITSEGAVSQMAYRGELPKTAFPGKRRACWFVADVRQWLDNLASARGSATTREVIDTLPKIGRPRLPVDRQL